MFSSCLDKSDGAEGLTDAGWALRIEIAVSPGMLGAAGRRCGPRRVLSVLVQSNFFFCSTYLAVDLSLEYSLGTYIKSVRSMACWPRADSVSSAFYNSGYLGKKVAATPSLALGRADSLLTPPLLARLPVILAIRICRPRKAKHDPAWVPCWVRSRMSTIVVHADTLWWCLFGDFLSNSCSPCYPPADGLRT